MLEGCREEVGMLEGCREELDMLEECREELVGSRLMLVRETWTWRRTAMLSGQNKRMNRSGYLVLPCATTVIIDVAEVR